MTWGFMNDCDCLKRCKDRWIECSLGCGYAILLVILFPFLFSSIAVPSEDLPGHIAAIKLLRSHMLEGRLLFYDPSVLGGWPAFQFYGFAAHLLVALLSLPFTPFADAPVELAANLSIFAAFALLPHSLFYGAQMLLRPELLHQHLEKSIRALVFFFCCILSLWFLTSDEQYFGLGAGAGLYLGLLPQVFAWHLLLIYAGVALRMALRAERGIAKLAIIFAFLLLTHALTAVYAAILGGVCFLLTPRLRKDFAIAHVLGGALTGFWIIPFIVLSKGYILPDPYPAGGDIMRFVFRYPLPDLLRLVASDGLFAIAKINFGYLLVAALIAAMFLSAEARRSKLLRLFVLALLIQHLLLDSSYVGASIPMGLHYYRFNAMSLLLLLVPLAAVPTFSTIRRNPTERTITLAKPALYAWLTAGTIAIATMVHLPPLEHAAAKAVIENNSDVPFVQLADALKADAAAGRVLTEQLNDYKRFQYLSAHKLSTRVAALSGREMENGLFVESSIANRIASVSAALLGANVFSPYLIFIELSDLTPKDNVQMLRSFGVSHFIAGTKACIDALTPFAAEAPKQVGPYTVISLGAAPPIATAVTKPVIGYVDIDGSLPFYLVDFYFSSRSILFNNYVLVELRDIPISKEEVNGIDALLIHQAHTNDNPNDLPKRLDLKFGPNNIAFSGPSPLEFNHYQREYPLQKSIQRFEQVSRYLDSVVVLPRLLQSFNLRRNLPSDAQQPSFAWNENHQGFTVRGAASGIPLKINYSYFPLWNADGGQLFRGSQQQMYLFPERDTVSATYSQFHSWSYFAGWLITFAAIAALIKGIPSKADRQRSN